MTDVFKYAATIPMSDEVAAEAFLVTDEIYDAFDALWRRQELDYRYGRDTRHHPDRFDYNEVMKPTWRQERIRSNVSGRPAGRMLRPTGS